MKFWKLIGTLLLGAACFADTTTTRIGLVEPTAGSTGWATKLNNNFGVIDSSVAVLTQSNTFTGTNQFQGTTLFPNLTAGQCLQLDSSHQVTSQACITPPGSDTQVIYNQGGTFAGSANFTFNGSTISVPGIASSTMTIRRILWPDGTIQTSSPTVVTGPAGAAGSSIYPSTGMPTFPYGVVTTTVTASTVAVNAITNSVGTSILTTNGGVNVRVSSITFADGTILGSTNSLTVNPSQAILNQSTLQSGATFYVPFGTLTKLVVTSTFSVTGDSITLGTPSSQISIPTLAPSRCVETDSAGRLSSASDACGSGSGGSGIVSPGTFTWVNNHGIQVSTFSVSVGPLIVSTGITGSIYIGDNSALWVDSAGLYIADNPTAAAQAGIELHSFTTAGGPFVDMWNSLGREALFGQNTVGSLQLQTFTNGTSVELGPNATSPSVLVAYSTGVIINSAIKVTSNTILSGTTIYQDSTASAPTTWLARGSGATSSTFWRGDGTWAAPSGGGGGGNTNAANQFSVPYYSLAGSSTALSAFPGVTFSTNTGILMSLSSKAVQITSNTILSGSTFYGDGSFRTGAPDIHSTFSGILGVDASGLVGTAVNLSNPLPTAQGGTGKATPPTNGQLLIGHTASGYDLATITPTAPVAVANAAGSITLSLTQIPSSLMVSSVAYISSTQTWTAQQTYNNQITLSSSVFAGATTGTNGQVLTSGGSGAAVSWTTISAGTGSGIVSPGTFTWQNTQGITVSTLTVTSTATIAAIVFSGTGNPSFTPNNGDTSFYQFVGSSASVTNGHLAIFSSSMSIIDGGAISAGSGITALTGDVTASGSGSVAATLAAQTGSLRTLTSSMTFTQPVINFGTLTSTGTVQFTTNTVLGTGTTFYQNGQAIINGVNSSTWLTGNQTITLSGDDTGSGTTSIAVTHGAIESHIKTFTSSETFTAPVLFDGTVTSTATVRFTTNTVLGAGTTFYQNGQAVIGGAVTASNLSGTNTGDQTITLTGDVTGSGTGSFATTAAAVQSNIKTFNVSSMTFTGALITGTSTWAAVNSSGTLIPNASLANIFVISLASNVTLNGPTNGTNGQKVEIRLIQDGVTRTVTLSSDYIFGADITSLTFSTGGSKTDELGVIYNATKSKWEVVSKSFGF